MCSTARTKCAPLHEDLAKNVLHCTNKMCPTARGFGQKCAPLHEQCDPCQATCPKRKYAPLHESGAKTYPLARTWRHSPAPPLPPAEIPSLGLDRMRKILVLP